VSTIRCKSAVCKGHIVFIKNLKNQMQEACATHLSFELVDFMLLHRRRCGKVLELPQRPEKHWVRDRKKALDENAQSTFRAFSHLYPAFRSESDEGTKWGQSLFWINRARQKQKRHLVIFLNFLSQSWQKLRREHGLRKRSKGFIMQTLAGSSFAISLLSSACSLARVCLSTCSARWRRCFCSPVCWYSLASSSCSLRSLWVACKTSLKLTPENSVFTRALSWLSLFMSCSFSVCNWLMWRSSSAGSWRVNLALSTVLWT